MYSVQTGKKKAGLKVKRIQSCVARETVKASISAFIPAFRSVMFNSNPRVPFLDSELTLQ